MRKHNLKNITQKEVQIKYDILLDLKGLDKLFNIYDVGETSESELYIWKKEIRYNTFIKVVSKQQNYNTIKNTYNFIVNELTKLELDCMNDKRIISFKDYIINKYRRYYLDYLNLI